MEKTIKASPRWVNAKPGATFAAKQHVVLSHHKARIGTRLTEAN